MPSCKSRFDRRFLSRRCWSVAIGLGLASCAAPPTPAPSAPAPVASTPPAASATPPSPSSATAAPEASAPNPATSEAPAPPSETKPSEEAPRPTPIAILTAKDVAFMVDYANSDAKARAAATCDQEAKGDPEARAACLDKARQKFLPDVLRFDQDKQKHWSLVVYKRSESTLKEVYIGRVQFVDETPDSVRLSLSQPESGPRPLFRSGRNLIQVPNVYSLELEDPQLGKLTYQAKIGLVPPR
jgi:hypothetical protein